MKKLFLSLLAIGSLTFGAQAQEMNYGLTAGANFANLTGDFEDSEMKVGANFGVFTEFGATEQLTIQPELKFSMQGAKNSNDDDLSNNLNYINIPIKVKFGATDMLDVYLGPQVGFLVTAEAEYDGKTQDVKDLFKSTDFGGVAGIDYISDMGFGAGLGYNFGLSNINDADNSDDYTIKNSVINLNLIYNFSNY